MKNLKLFLAVAITAALFTTCKPEVSSVELNKTALVMGNGEQQFLTATVLPKKADQSVFWSSSNTGIVSVDEDGQLTAKAFGDVTITAKAGDKTATCKVYVPAKINGIFWAASNVDAFGKFAPTPQSYGMFYQWNRPTAWKATGNDITGWNSTNPTGNTWTATNDPCPDGWRVPTEEELESLSTVAGSWTSNGRYFGTSPNQIFLPAAGQRLSTDGSIKYQDTQGYYWSNTEKSNTQASFLMLSFGTNSQNDKTYGLSVRCVAK